MNVREYLNKLKTFNLLTEIEAIINDNEKKVTELIQQQLSEGKRGDGTLLPMYKESTKIIKRERGTILLGDRIALIDTGEFWNSIFATAYKGSVEIDAKDWKRDELVARYDEEIFLLSKESLEELSELVHTELKIRWNEHISS
jgi:hypothetical protein